MKSKTNCGGNFGGPRDLNSLVLPLCSYAARWDAIVLARIRDRMVLHIAGVHTRNQPRAASY